MFELLMLDLHGYSFINVLDQEDKAMQTVKPINIVIQMKLRMFMKHMQKAWMHELSIQFEN